MATPGRRKDPPLEDEFFEEPYRFDFFQAVRLLERLRPDRAPIGRDGPATREVARFVAHLTLNFPASSIHRLARPANSDAPPEMTVSFLGLTGPMGALPYAFTELLQERWREGDRTPAAFFDLFNHRMVSFFFRAWERCRPALSFERGRDDRFSEYLFNLIGLGARPLRGRHAFPDEALPYYVGIFAQRRRPAVMLEALLADAFGLPIEVHQFAGRWLKLEPGDRSILGASGRHNQLGSSMVLGERTWDDQGKFRLRVGPLTFAQFLELSPDGPSLRPMAEMTRLYVDTELDFDVQLVLKAEEVPRCQLQSAAGAGARLGRYAWLGGGEFANDVDDAVFPANV